MGVANAQVLGECEDAKTLGRTLLTPVLSIRTQAPQQQAPIITTDLCLLSQNAPDILLAYKSSALVTGDLHFLLHSVVACVSSTLDPLQSAALRA